MAQYKCSQCGKEYSFEKIRYGRDGKRIVCVNCYKSSMEYDKNKMKEVQFIKEDRPRSNFIKLICIDCRYKFNLRRGSRIRPTCPYCGKSRLMKDEANVDQL